jgi:hypothetical protein
VCKPETPPLPLKVGVFGSIEDDRRNYSGLLAAIKSFTPISQQVGFRVYLVGKAPQKVRDYIQGNHLENLIEFYPDFVPFRRMFLLLAEMDIVLFLIDRTVKNSKHYNRYKITGTSTLLKAFKKAGASSSDFPVDDTLGDKCFYYPGSDVGGFLRQISEGTITKDDIRKRTAAYEGQTVFSFAEQQGRLVSAIQGALRSPRLRQVSQTEVQCTFGQ